MRGSSGTMIKLRFTIFHAIHFASALHEMVIDPAPLQIPFYSVIDHTIK